MKTREEEAHDYLSKELGTSWFNEGWRSRNPAMLAAHLEGQRVGEQRVVDLLRSEATKGVGHHYDSLAFAVVFLETKLKELK